MNLSLFSKRNRWSGAFAIVLLLLGSIFPLFSYAQQKTTVTQGPATQYGGGGTIYNANGSLYSTSYSNPNGQTVTTSYGQAGGYNQTTQSNVNVSNGAPGAIGSCVGSIASGYITKYITSFLGSTIDADHVSSQSGNDYSGGTASVDGEHLVGWDAIAYCIGNGLLTYITNSVVAWINGGFNGSPAFISNPTEYFQGIADIEAGTLINTIAKDTTGLNICQPFNINIGAGLLNSYSPQNPLTCSLQQLQSNLSNPNNIHVTAGGQTVTAGSGLSNTSAYNSYVGGTGSYSNFNNTQAMSNLYGISQNQQNNPQGAYLLGQQQLAYQINSQQNTANISLNWGNGFQSVQNCPPSQSVVNQQGVTIQNQRPCETTTPGNVIASQLDKTLGLGDERVVLAQKFDQVISALVGTLIKLALNKLLT